MKNKKIRISRRRLTDRQAYSIVLTLTALIAVAGLFQFRRAQRLEAQVENGYQRAFHDLVDYVENIDAALAKAMLSNDGEHLAIISSELWQESAFARACLGQLPASNLSLDNAADFLAQVGDYTYTLTKKVIHGGEMTAEEGETLRNLSGYAASLTASLQEMEVEMSDVIWNGGSNAVSAGFFSGEDARFHSVLDQVEEEFADYPSLVYDGPFSDHIKNREWRMLKGQPTIETTQAEQIALDFLGRDEITAAVYEGENVSEQATTYRIALQTAEEAREITLEVTAQGGFPLLLLDNRQVEAANMSVEGAAQYARAFLQEKGYHSMKESYYQRIGNTVWINYAYVQDDFVMYTDLIKVKVAMDNGDIIGYESMGYLVNHTLRELPQVTVSREEALRRVNPGLTVERTNLALVPTDSQRDVFCYEIQGKFNERNYILYINVQSGEEEKILLLQEDENGVLTI